MRWTIVDEMNEKDCWPKKEMRWNVNKRSVDWSKWDETWTIKCELNKVIKSPSLTLYKRVKNKCYCFLCLFVHKITQTFQLAGIQLKIQHSSKYLFHFLIIRPDFVLTDRATLFEGMSVLGGATAFCDVVSLGSMMFS